VNVDRWLNLLRAFYTTLRAGMREQWHRDLPFEELLFDRWERARSLGFGEGTSIYHNSYVYGDVQVGQHTWIGPYSLLDGSGGLTIGDYCSISAGVYVYTHTTVAWAVSGGKAEYERAPVKIGSCCYIGAQTVIAMGVTIGDHCVIGACSFVNRDIPPYTVAFGTPCRPAGHVEIDESGVVHLK
jgi:acetyltransferase-like isoleucine patch superfamily enzyme